MITVSEASKLLGGTPGWVRSLCDRAIIGDVWGNGNQRKTYVIVPSKLAKYMEITEEELSERVEELRNVDYY